MANIMAMNTFFLNCTLKKSPQISNTHAFIDRAEFILKELGVKSQGSLVRILFP